MMEFTIEQGVLKGCQGDAAIVEIPEGVREIGYGAFRNCRSLQQLAVPAGVQRIGSQAFAGCEGLEHVELAEGIREIGYSAFENCVKLKKVVLPSGLVSLERLAFAGCHALLEIEFSDTLLDVGRDAFRDTPWLASQEDGVIYAGKLALFAKGAVSSVVIRPGTIKICENAFRNHSALTEISLPESMQILGDRAFENCRRLKQITIPQNVTFIGYRAFHECRKLQVLLECDKVVLGKACFEADTQVRITALDPALLPNQVLHSAILAFVDDWCGQTALEKDFVSQMLRYIRSRRKLLYPLAIAHWNLLQVMMENDIIPAEDINEMLEQILAEEQAEATAALMEYRQKLTSDNKQDCFESWDDLELSWDMPEQEKTDAQLEQEWGTKLQRDGTLTLLLYRGQDREVTVPSRIGEKMVTAIAPAALSPERYGIKRETIQQRQSICAVTIQEGITKIGNHAFSGCENLVRVSLPESVVEIGYHAFRNCKKLIEIQFPQSIEKIGRGAFAGCSSLAAVHLPEGIQLAEDAFAGCPLSAAVEGVFER